ncbi:MAG: diguanylate cyclase [Coprobacillus sp.]
MIKLKQIIENENDSFRQYRKDIDHINYSMFRFMIVIAMIVFVLLLMISFVVENFLSLRYYYLFPLLLCGILYLSIRTKPPHAILLSLIYIFCSCFVALGIYLSAIDSPESLGATIIGILLIIPLTIIDKSWRITIMMCVCYILFVISSFVFKTTSLAIDDTVTAGIFTIASLMLGHHMCSIKLTNIANQHRLRTLSDTDVLTRLYNRRKLESSIKKKAQTEFAGVIMIDIDFFKQYNDEYGHQVGDECLEEIGACLQRISRLYHLKAYRYGGEEFIMISHHHTYDELYLIATEIKKEVKRLQIPFEESPFKVVTMSAGVSEAHVCHTTDMKKLIDMADKALYHGKRHGRNIIVGYTQEKG